MEVLVPPTDYAKIDATVSEIIETVASYMTSVPKETIRHEISRAYEFARAAHEGQFRKSGDPYIIHPVEAAKILTVLKPDLTTLQCCFLHDVPEDTSVTVAEISDEFGAEVAHIVSGMEKLSKVKYLGEERSIGSMRKMFVAMSKDLRLILVKFADRIHNMRTLDSHPDPEKRERIALETLNIYAPIADRLGIFDFKEMLENECFRILYPDQYARIRKELCDLKEEQDIFVADAKEILLEYIPKTIRIHEISTRIKSPYSIFKKMERKGYENVRELYDLFALRIITETIPNCYEILGIIHSQFAPVPKRFKDYIALPKPNGYQSLHTTVLGLIQDFRKLPTEIQIRTMAMHKQAEIGVAAHFEYSEIGKSVFAQDIDWVKDLKELLEKSSDSDLIFDMKTNVFDDRIFVFTPKGAVINLPKGSTPVDFAYAIHSELGNQLSIAKVNERVVPLDYFLHNGDRIEIVTEKNKRPSVTWLSFVKTTRAKEVIRSQINKEQHDVLIEKGKSMLSSYLEKHFGKKLDKEMSILKNVDGRVLDTKGKEEILLQIGNLSRKPSSVVRVLDINLPARTVFQAPISASVPKKKEEADHGFGEVIIGGQSRIPHRFGECCQAKPGDRIVGYVNKRGVVIHKVSCPSIKKGSLDRLIPAQWSNVPLQPTRMRLEILLENRIGVLRKLTDIFFLMRINIEEISQESSSEGLARLTIAVSIDEEDYYLYERLVERMKLSIAEFRSAKLLELA